MESDDITAKGREIYFIDRNVRIFDIRSPGEFLQYALCVMRLNEHAGLIRRKVENKVVVGNLLGKSWRYIEQTRPIEDAYKFRFTHAMLVRKQAKASKETDRDRLCTPNRALNTTTGSIVSYIFNLQTWCNCVLLICFCTSLCVFLRCNMINCSCGVCSMQLNFRNSPSGLKLFKALYYNS